MVWCGRVRPWGAVTLCLVLAVACSSKTRTVGVDGADGGGGHAAHETSGGAGANVAGTTSAGGMQNNAGQPSASGAAGVSGSATQGGNASGLAGESGSDGRGSDGGASVIGGRAGSFGEGGEAGHDRAGGPADSDAGATTAGAGGTEGCQGVCGCEGWWGDCDGVAGCETPLDGPEHCGACGRVATVYEHARMICTSADGALPVCEPGFGDCDLTQLDCETGFDDGQPSCLPEYLGSIALDRRIVVSALSLGPNGEIYLAGSYTGAVDFDPGPASDVIVGNQYDAGFVTKLSADGSYLWTRTFSGTSDSQAWCNDVAVGPDGSVLLLGTLKGNADLDPSAASDLHAGTVAAFVVALSEDGEYRFGRSYGSADFFHYGSSLARSESGESYVLMHTERRVGSLVGRNGLLLTKLDAAGQTLWVRASSGSECTAFPKAVGATAEGVVATASMEVPCELDGFPDEPPRAGGLIARYDTGGGGTDLGFLESAWPEFFANVSGADTGGWLVAGLTEGRSDLDPGPAVASRGLAENVIAGFIARFDEGGAFIWGQVVPNLTIVDMTVAENGNVFLSGFGLNRDDELLAFSPDSRSRFALSFDGVIRRIAANAQTLIFVGNASGGADIDPTSGVDLATQDAVFVVRLALGAY